MIQVGINGFGRIGRVAFRGDGAHDVEIVAVNDLLELRTSPICSSTTPSTAAGTM
jgi:glyceraldehyde-3-phosphate dehydrogenase/erythrose-4-phosphate dehydrogenase